MVDMDPSNSRELALAAASQAAEATAELIAYAREGAQGARSAFDNEPIEKLADATKMAIAVMRAEGDRIDPDLNQLHGALERFLEGWA